ncbi:MAG TPA: YciI family protein [Candidatus Acidoferrum sp.]|nr:YciI family protein [Candidatus Acidoferrum sp.]
MQYVLLIYSDESRFPSVTAEQAQEMMKAYDAYTTALREAGAYVAGNRLDFTPSATTIRASGGKIEVIDGPFAETKEQLGGYYLIEAPDGEAALRWASRCPGVMFGASIEVRPVMPVPVTT